MWNTCNTCNSCSNVWRNSGCGCNNQQRICRDCNGNIWVRVANSNGCYVCNSCGCNGSNGNGATFADAGFGCCARQTSETTFNGNSRGCGCSCGCND